MPQFLAAMKANAMRDDEGVGRDVSRSPATVPTKGSEAGRQAVVREGGRLTAQRLDATAPCADLLAPVWRGALLVRHAFDTIRARSETPA